ncbi:translation initiation factor IF-2 [bacterium]|nr:translation initiation factor IF-2 [bacterium]
MNVTELARQLKITTSELLEILPGLGFDIGAKAIKVDNSLVDKIKQAYAKHKKQERLQEKEADIEEIKIGDKEKNKEESDEERIIELEDNIIVKDLAEKMDLPLNKVMTELMRNGVMVSLNSDIDFETASIIAEDLGFKTEKSSQNKKKQKIEKEKILKLEELLDKNKNSEIKTPVVVVMGHVDHGKTKLLDTLRNTNIIDKEAGNITQHIGAYKVELNDKEITFLDTPGHEAFKAMRSRGTKIADIGIIVVAADEGLKPQTIESIELAQKEELPFIIAINKIDKPNADPEKVKKELSELNLTPEEWGGKTICVEISAKENKNLEGLLEMINLVAEMENLTTDKSRQAIGTIIESHIDKNQGPVATILVQTGTLKLGDNFISGNTFGKVKAMIDHLGQNLKEAGPSTPVQILGFKQAPLVGDIFNCEISDKEIKKLKKQSSNKNIKDSKIDTKKDTDSTNLDEDENPKYATLNIILKADVVGSKEAIIESIKKLEKEDVKIKIIKNNLGNVTDKDILDAETSNAIILGFHVQTNTNAELLAKEKNVKIKNYDIIYKLLEDLEEKIKNITPSKTIREQIGELKVLAIFRTAPNKTILGGKVTKGKIDKDSTAKVIRKDELITVGKIVNLQSGKENVNEVSEGQECGLEFSGDANIEENDTIELYRETIV